MAIPSNSAAPTRPTESVIFDKGALRGSIGLAVLSVAGFGFLYSMVGVGLGQALFSDAANGSLIERDGKVIGSIFAAQPFADDRYFSSRPSAVGHQPMSAGGSNQARTNPDMRKRVQEAVATVALREGVQASQVPGDLVTQSGGGFDPHISPQGAQIQVQRVARARGLSADAVIKRVAEHTEPAQLGVLGQARVNVMALNLALDHTSAATAPTPNPR